MRRAEAGEVASMDASGPHCCPSIVWGKPVLVCQATQGDSVLFPACPSLLLLLWPHSIPGVCKPALRPYLGPVSVGPVN